MGDGAVIPTEGGASPGGVTAVLLGSGRQLVRDLLRQRTTRRRAWIVVAAFLVCAYAAAVLAYVIATPEIGVRCAFTPIVNHFYDEFLYPADQPPLREGDRILRVGDQDVENWSQLVRKLNLMRDETPQDVAGLSADDLRHDRVRSAGGFIRLDDERVVRVRYQRPGESEPRVVWCRLGRSPVETLVPSVLWFFLKIGLFVVGALVFWKRPDDRSAEAFFWLCIFSFGAFMGGYHWSRIVTQPVLLLVWMVCAVLLPAVTLHFYLLFPRPKAFYQARPWTTLAVIYGPGLLFLVLLVRGYFYIRLFEVGGVGEPADVRVRLREMLNEIYLYFGVAAVLYLGSVASLLHSYRTAATPVEGNQVKWILVGSAAALGPLGYSFYLAVWEPGRFGAGEATWPMFAASALITLAYTVSITRYRLMQLDQLISSGAAYFLASAVGGLVYYGVMFAGLLAVGSQFGAGPTLWHVAALASAALLVLVALNTVRGGVFRALDRHFRREKHQLDRTLQRMSQAIERLVDPPALARRLLHTSAELLGAAGGAVYLRQGEPALYRLTDAIGPAPTLAELPPGCPLIQALRQQATFVPGPAAAPAAVRQLEFLGGAVAQALTHEGQTLGLLVLGPRADATYTAEDVQLLAAFAQVTALALVGAEGHRLIEKLNRELKDKVEKIAQQQRRIVALQSQLSRKDEAAGMKEEGKPEESATPPPAYLLAPFGLVGSGPQVRHLMQQIKRVAVSSSVVLLRGESGTGKELLARALHENSPRAGKPFVKVHCAALSQGLLESELFGHVKGAFTSAIRDKAGRFEAADGGTLFLDEIGDINLEVQTKLLRVLEEMTFERVGSNEPVQVDVRIIAATHRDLEAMIAQGRFREDLYFRINVLPIHVPPLRDRAEDVPELVAHFLQVYGQRTGKAVTAVEDDALVALKAFDWPGNVRQLENVIERAVVIAEGLTVGLDELPEEVRDAAERAGPARTEAVRTAPVNGVGLSLPELAQLIHTERAERDRREREQLARALASAGGNKAEAARALGIARSTLLSRLKKLGLS